MKRNVLIGFLLLLMLGGQALGQGRTLTVTGVVTDAGDRATLPGVSIMIKDTSQGTVTDINGRYELTVPADAVLVFSYIGMQTREVPVDGRSVINVAMESALVGLDEVIVVAYGTQRRDAVTGSIGTVDSRQIERIPMASFDQILQGQSAGVSSVSSSGRPGAAATITIRGVGTINSGAAPLYVIDGVPMTERLNSIYDNPLSGINPNDIESVNILKDASATAIYGSRAANGVIIVTTRRGTIAERSNLTYRGQYGVSSLTRDDFNMMNTEQKLQFERDNNIYTRADAVWDSLGTINTNWRDEMFRTGITQSHELSSSGGGQKTRYYVSGAFFNQDGILQRSDYQRMSGRLNLDHFISDYLKFGANINMSFEEANYTVAEGGYGNNVYNPVFAAYLMNPYEQPRTPEGEYITGFATFFGNPLRELELNQDLNNTLKLLGNLFAEYEPIRNLQLRSSIGTDFYDYTFDDYLHPAAVWGSDLGGSTSRGLRRAHTTTFSNTARYNTLLANVHEISLLGGTETTQYNIETFSLRGDGFASDKVRVPGAASIPFSVGGTAEAFNLLSFFTQLTYNYDSRWFADFSFRRDGSSRFGSDNQFANFWSAGVNWNVKQESFMANVNFLSALRIRSSYGTTGNYMIGNYEHLGTYSVALSYDQLSGSAPVRPANPRLTWETSESFNVGLESEFFNRIGFEVDFYNRITKDMLLAMPVSRTSGFTSERRNIGQMTNTGVELTLNGDVVRASNFTWHFNANFTYNRNRIDELYLGVEEFVTGNTIVKEGEAMGTFFYNRFAGVNPANGRPLWYDVHGNITTEHRDADRVVLTGQSSQAPYFGGFTNNFHLGNFQLNAFFTFVLDRWMVNNTKYFIANQSNFGAYNQSADVLNHWKQPGDNVAYPVYGTVPASIFDTRFLENASFLRLRNLTLAYSLPETIVQNARLRSIRLYVQGQNLWTLTEYTGFDPEYPFSSELSAYPATRTITFGIDLGL